MIDQIYNIDCIAGMSDIPDGSIDAIICDLPYGVTNKKSEAGKWDTVIPFEDLWKQYVRITKPDSPIILFGQGMFTADLMHSNRKMWRYNLIWKKGSRCSALLNANRMPLMNHEDICVFYRSLPVYHPQKSDGKPNHSRGNVTCTTNRCYGEYDMTVQKDDFSGKKFPLSVIDIDREHTTERFHPTQKPVALIEYLIRTFTDEGDIVLDNCMGSGTTAVACIRTGRHYIGYETDPVYYAKALERISSETRQTSLF